MKALILAILTMALATMLCLKAVDKALDDTKASIHHHNHTIEE